MAESSRPESPRDVTADHCLEALTQLIEVANLKQDQELQNAAGRLEVRFWGRIMQKCGETFLSFSRALTRYPTLPGPPG